MIAQSSASQARRWADDPVGMSIKARVWARNCRRRQTPEQRREAWRRYYARHADRIRANARAYAKAHREARLAYQQRYAKTHAAELRAYARRYYWRNREQVLLRGRLRYHQRKTT